MLSVPFEIVVINKFAIEIKMSLFGGVQARNQFYQGSLAAPVSSGDKYQLARFKAQIEWTEDETLAFIFAAVGVEFGSLSSQIDHTNESRFVMTRCVNCGGRFKHSSISIDGDDSDRSQQTSVNYAHAHSLKMSTHGCCVYYIAR